MARCFRSLARCSLSISAGRQRRNCAAGDALPFSSVDEYFSIENCLVMKMQKAATGFHTIKFARERYEEFLHAEMHYLGQGSYNKIRLEEVLENSEPERLARMICRELPPRFASRMRQIEATPDWRSVLGMSEAHGMYEKSFRNLRIAETDGPVAKELDLHAIAEVVRDIKARHDPALPNFARIASELKARGTLAEEEVTNWVWKVMNARVGTEILTSHYLELIRGCQKNHVGIVNMCCQPYKVCSDAIDRVKSCLEGIPIEFELIGEETIRLPFIDKYLFCIVEELLKNAASAALVCIEKGKQQGTQVIQLHLAAGGGSLAIKVSDEAGGIAGEHLDSLWNYMFSVTPEQIQDVFAPIANPLTMPCMGLPLARLYAEYLGGSLTLVSMPGVGVDAFLRLKLIDLVTLDSTHAEAQED
mmetsp:Transcript_55152/g.129122  ORF Transcript_55152/g.129122 Transcript_55152/m.129122 type:complete len:418 (-) Transcript_55152:75-1328(-)